MSFNSISMCETFTIMLNVFSFFLVALHFVGNTKSAYSTFDPFGFHFVPTYPYVHEHKHTRILMYYIQNENPPINVEQQCARIYNTNSIQPSPPTTGKYIYKKKKQKQTRKHKFHAPCLAYSFSCATYENHRNIALLV